MKKIFTLLVIIFLSQISLGQEKVYFPGFETINVHTKYQYISSKLFHNYVAEQNKYSIVLPDNLKKGEEYIESKNETQQQAKALKTTYYILADMSAMGNLLIVQMKMYNTSTNELFWTDVVKADKIEDLDPVLNTLAKNLGISEPNQKTDNIYNVTNYKSKNLNRKLANDSWGIILGGGTLFAKDIKSAGQSGFGVVKSYDMRDLILDLKAELYFGDQNNRSSRIGMNVLIPHSEKDQTLVYGGGFYYGGTEFSLDNTQGSYSNSNSGLELEGNIGYILNRTSSVQIRLMASPFFNFYKVNGTSVSGIRFGLMATF
ncbi:MAG: hypothetical protein ACPGTO_09975 [Polaribacter sp.]